MIKISKSVIVSVLLAVVVSVAVVPQSCQAAARNTAVSAIPEESRPSTAAPWFVAFVLTAAAVFVGTKNSRRTHLD